MIVPARDEEAALRRTAPALREAVRGLDAQVVYVLNATTDRSAEAIRAAFGDAATIIEEPRPGKAHALRRGDRAADRWPRFYIDADVAPAPDALRLLLEPLERGEADLVAPRLLSDPGGGLAGRVGAVWLSLPYARGARFQGLLGLSRAGRGAWGPWPDLIADDRFAALSVPAARRRIHPEATAGMPLPRTLRAWVGVRARWLRGQRELARLGLLPMGEAGHGEALRRLARAPSRWPDLALYAAVRGLAHPVCLWEEATSARWYRDRTTRHARGDRATRHARGDRATGRARDGRATDG